MRTGVDGVCSANVCESLIKGWCRWRLKRDRAGVGALGEADKAFYPVNHVFEGGRIFLQVCEKHLLPLPSSFRIEPRPVAQDTFSSQSLKCDSLVSGRVEECVLAQRSGRRGKRPRTVPYDASFKKERKMKMIVTSHPPFLEIPSPFQGAENWACLLAFIIL
jgi:hypothetical protein